MQNRVPGGVRRDTRLCALTSLNLENRHKQNDWDCDGATGCCNHFQLGTAFIVANKALQSNDTYSLWPRFKLLNGTYEAVRLDLFSVSCKTQPQLHRQGTNDATSDHLHLQVSGAGQRTQIFTLVISLEKLERSHNFTDCCCNPQTCLLFLDLHRVSMLHFLDFSAACLKAMCNLVETRTDDNWEPIYPFYLRICNNDTLTCRTILIRD